MQGCELGVEAHFAAGLLDLLADVAHDIYEQVGADVGFCLPQDLLRRARFHEQMQDVLRPGALMFVVSLPSENVPPRLRRTGYWCANRRLAGVEGVDRRHALVDRRAALDHKRAQTGARQVERAKQAGRAGAHHDGGGVRPAPGAKRRLARTCSGS